MTVRRVEFEGGFIKNNIDLADESNDAVCGTNLLIEDTTFEPEAGQPFTDDFSAVADGGYTARRVEMVNRGEGFRLGGCGPVTIEDSFVHIVGGITGDCDNPFPDPHSDGIQGFGGKGLTATNNTITFGEQCGTGPYSVGWGSANPANPPDNVGDYNIDRLLVAGGSYSFQHMTEDADIRGLWIVKGQLAFGPRLSACSKIDHREAKLATLNHSHRDADGHFRSRAKSRTSVYVDDYG